MKALITNFFKNEEGLETVEWGVMLFLIVAGLVTIVGLLGDEIYDIFANVLTELGGTPPAAP